MRFAVSPEQADFAASIGDLLRDAETPSVIRAWADGKHEPGLQVWRRLAELGVHGLLVPDDLGGIGADAVDVAVAFEVLGYHGMPGPLVESVAVLPVLLAGLDDPRADGWLRGLAAGELVGTLAAPPLVPYALDADTAGLRLLLADGELSGFEPGEPLGSVDPARRLYAPDGPRPLGLSAPAAGALLTGTLAVSAQLLGAGRRLLDDSVAYAKQRHQYGRPIGQFQAIKHLLADVVTGLELARPLVHAAAVALAAEKDPGKGWMWSSRPQPSTRDVSAAKVACTEAAYRAARAALQVHGAIGYTAEYDLGLWLTKVRALHGAWGTPGYHRRQVLEALDETQRRGAPR